MKTTSTYRFFTLLLVMLFSMLLMAGCVYTAEPSASVLETQTDTMNASVVHKYWAAPTGDSFFWKEEVYHNFYYIDAKVKGKGFSYSTVSDVEFCEMTVEEDSILLTIAKDMFTTGWDDLLHAAGTGVRLYFYLLGYSPLYGTQMGLYCGFETLEKQPKIKPSYDDLQAAITTYTAAFAPTAPPEVTVPDTGGPFPVYDNGPYTVGESMHEGLYLLLPEDYASNYTVIFPTDGYNRLLYSNKAYDRYVNPAFCMEYFQPGYTYTFNGVSAALLSDFTEYWGAELLNNFGKNKDGTFAQGTYQIGTMLSAGTYEIIPYDVEAYYYYYGLAAEVTKYGLAYIDDASEIVTDGDSRIITVEDGQFLTVQDAYIKSVKTTA